MITSPVQRDGRRGRRDLFRVPDMDRTRGLRVQQTKTPTSDGWRFLSYVFGGPGRNRTTDTRIFNLRAAPDATPSVCRARVLLLARSLAWIVTVTIPCHTRWRIAARFCVPIPYFVNKHHRRSDREVRTMDRLRTGRFGCAETRVTRYLPEAIVSSLPHPSPKIRRKTGKRQSRGRSGFDPSAKVDGLPARKSLITKSG